MTMPGWMSGHPKKILLATDLSARCDRALDRAVSLAGQWQAELVVLHVMEERLDVSDITDRLPSWRRPADPVDAAYRRLLADLGDVAEKARVMIEQGDPVDTIVRVADSEGCDLIVTGLARDEPFGRFSLGRTVDRLLRCERLPLLIVKDRPRQPYRNIVVATDFSDSSRIALEAAAHIFPQQQLTLFHAYEAPLAGRMADSTLYRKEYRKSVERECEEFLRGVGKPTPAWRAPNVLLEHGPPTLLLHDYVQEKEVDLLVLGTHGRSAIFEIFIGSVAKAILDGLPCDALVIREPRAATES
jgi:nucleotide-binding universal stress UspA family protein